MYRESEQSEHLYTRVAPRYEQVFERAMLAEARPTELVRLHLNGRRVLDLACGNARWIDRFEPSHYVGLDLNGAMLREGRERYGAAALLRADMTRLPFGDGSFEGVMSMFGAMGHLPPAGQAAMIKEIERVLAPGGVAIITNGNMWSPFNLPTTLIGNRVRLEKVRFKVHSTTTRRFAEELARLRVESIESYDYSYLPILPLKFGACLLGRDWRAAYEKLMETLDHGRCVPPLRWFGKQLVAVCRKREAGG